MILFSTFGVYFKMAGDRPGQPAYEIFSTKRRGLHFNSVSSYLINSRSLPYEGLKFGYSFKRHYYFIACCTRLPRWQNRCYRASRELCSIICFHSRLCLRLSASVGLAPIACTVHSHRLEQTDKKSKQTNRKADNTNNATKSLS